MAATESVGKFLRPGPGTHIPAIQRLNDKSLRLGFIMVLLTGQVFFMLLATVFGSAPAILPGNWQPYATDYTFYIVLDILALLFIGFSYQRYEKVVIQPGGFRGFSITFFFFALAAWGATLAYLWAVGVPLVGTTQIDDTTRLQYFVLYGLFVGPTEELFFRVALPEVTGWVIAAAIIFPVFHLFAYTAGVTGSSGLPLVLQLANVAILGVVFWFIRDRWGYGASTGAHVAYNLTVVGVISTLSLVGIAVALVPV